MLNLGLQQKIPGKSVEIGVSYLLYLVHHNELSFLIGVRFPAEAEFILFSTESWPCLESIRGYWRLFLQG
jgi:hypothetical protein